MDVIALKALYDKAVLNHKEAARILLEMSRSERGAFNEYIEAVADQWLDRCRELFPTPQGSIENVIRTVKPFDQDYVYNIYSDISCTGVSVGREILTLKGRKRLGLKVERYTQTLQHTRNGRVLDLYSERYQLPPIMTVTHQTYSRYNPDARELAEKFGVSRLPLRDRDPSRLDIMNYDQESPIVTLDPLDGAGRPIFTRPDHRYDFPPSLKSMYDGS